MMTLIDLITSDHPWIGDLLWQSTLFLALGLLTSRLLGNQPARAHAALMLAICTAIIAPIASAVLRGFGIGLLTPVEAETVTGALLLDDMAAAREGAGGASILLGAACVIWLAASAMLLVRVAAHVRYGRRIVAASRSAHCSDVLRAFDRARALITPDNQNVRLATLRQSDALRTPAVWCWSKRPVVLIPASMCGAARDHVSHDRQPQDTLTAVFTHELAHIRRHDHWWTLLCALAGALLPWNPLVWVASRQARLHSERACDAAALTSGVEPRAFAAQLIALINAQTRVTAMAPAMASTMSARALRRRIAAILDRSSRHEAINMRVIAIWSLAALLCTSAAAMAHRGEKTTDYASRTMLPIDLGEPIETFSGGGIVATPRELDLGVIAPGTIASSRLFLVNIDTRPIELTGIKTSCGCTTVKGFDTGPLASAAIMQLTVHMEAPSDHDTRKEKTIVVFTEGDRRIEIPVTVRTSPEP